MYQNAIHISSGLLKVNFLAFIKGSNLMYGGNLDIQG